MKNLLKIFLNRKISTIYFFMMLWIISSIIHWPSIIHELGHFTASYLTGGQAEIVAINRTLVSDDNVIVRLAGFMSTLLFTYVFIWSNIPILRGAGFVMAFDFLLVAKFQTDMPSSILPALLMSMLLVITGGLLNGRKHLVRSKQNASPVVQRDSPVQRSTRRSPGEAIRSSEPGDWIEEIIGRYADAEQQEH